MSSTIGTLFTVTTFGESHGRGIGAIVDGCPPRLPLAEEVIQAQLDRRRPGQSDLSTKRDEKDQVRLLSGVQDGMTLGTPLALMVENKDQRPGDYKSMTAVPRPSHADFTYDRKYGIRAASGGGRASARETIARVAAGAIAEVFLARQFGVGIVAWVSSVGAIECPEPDGAALTRADVDRFDTRCPHAETSERMTTAIREARDAGDSMGGIVTCVCTGVPAGLGEPVFHKLEAMLAGAMLSIPAVKGFEVGSGFAGTRMHGSEHNDMFVRKGDSIGTETNRSGGIQGGISNGEPIVFRVAFKPPATIAKAQKTVDAEGNDVVLEAKGRHDPCVVPRAVPIVETMAALTLADAALIQNSRDWPGSGVE